MFGTRRLSGASLLRGGLVSFALAACLGSEGAARSSATELQGADLPALKWSWAEPGEDFGTAGMVAVDLDGDGLRELVTNGCSLRCWLVIDQGPAGVRQRRASLPVPTYQRIAATEAQNGASGSVLMAGSGFVRIQSSSSEVADRVLSIPNRAVRDLLVVDLEIDGDLEILVLNDIELLIYDFATGDLVDSWSSSGGQDMDIGPGDGDPQLEIAIAEGEGPAWVLDGVTLEIQWSNGSLVGDRLALRDVTGDGLAEVIAPRWSSDLVRVIDPRTDTVILTAPASWDPVLADAADFDSDGIDELLVADSNGFVHALSASTGTELGILEGDFGYPTALVVAQLGTDPAPEIAWALGSHSDTSLVISDAVLGAAARRLANPSGPYLGIDTGRIDTSGSADVLATSQVSARGDGSGLLLRIRGLDGTVLMTSAPIEPSLNISWLGEVVAATDGTAELQVCLTYREVNSPYLACLGAHQATPSWTLRLHETYSVRDLSVGDLDLDGARELTFAVSTGGSPAHGGLVYALDAETGWLEWRSPPLFSPTAWFVRAGVGQLDLDGPLEIFSSSYNPYPQLSTTVLIDGATGSAGPELSAIGIAAQTLVDLDGDGVDEILVAGIDGAVGVLDPISGTLVSTIGTYPGPIRSLAVGDVVGDDALEVVIALADRIQIVEVSGGTVPWTSPTLGEVQYEALRVADLDEFAHDEILVATTASVLAFGIEASPPLIVRDGFETGTLVGWSRSQED